MQTIIILDFGGQYKELIARMVRGLNVYAEILPGNISTEILRKKNPIGLILADGVQRVNAPDAPMCNAGLFQLGVPVMQFDPRMLHAPSGNEQMRNFLYDTCGAAGDYQLKDYIPAQVKSLRETIGGEKVLLGLSGGVDSSVCAALLAKAVPGQLVCIFVDHGLMRLNEGDEIEAAFSNRDLHFIRVDASARFFSRLLGVTDSEQKRKIIGEEFIHVFEEEAAKLGDIPFLAQGTIYPDIVESGAAYGTVIKSHHNVGGLPENLKFAKIVEPLSLLFKNEVRDLGRRLKLPAAFINRQPFPGPGLAVRITGEITAQKLDTLRRADAIFREEVGKLKKRPDQYFAILTDTLSVGIKGNIRTYDPVIALRAVTSVDFMTATTTPLPHKMLAHCAARITNEIAEVSRVVYDITAKPPGTVEWL